MADNINHYSRYSPQDRSLRASDHDREAIGDLLRREHVAGRLDADEFADRYGRCLEAKTYAQLDGLIADLPFDGRAPYQPGPASWANSGSWANSEWTARRWRAGRRLWRIPAFAWVILFLALALGAHVGLWLAFPLFFFFVVRPLIWALCLAVGGALAPGGDNVAHGVAGPGSPGPAGRLSEAL